ncbi:tyrosine-type recombinase/integrase [Ochrobactrum sp. A-1]|uniref:tyrosine-type recombinase/integrase n=1 Tax=Ochrobactrum sp. A-1 TaxID=2920940 RepID=UPI001F0B6159|nr:site-specific integrase [Ochrobactrum sp. A-1]
MAKITKTIIDNADVRDKAYFIWCSELPGFGARIFPTGKKSFYVDYYNQAGQRKRMSLGGFGKLTVEEARKMARIHLSDALRGQDPALERKTQRASLTITELCRQYFELADKGLIIGRKGKPKKQATIDTDRSMINAHAIPLIGSKPVLDLKRADIVKFIRDVSSGKTAKAKAPSGKLRGRVRVSGGAGSATRTVAALGSVLTYAVAEGIIDHNPTHGVKKPAIGKRERRLTPPEYAAFGAALNEAELDETKAWQGVNALRFIALTGCRLGEAINLRWAEVDIKNNLLKLEDSKTGKSVRPLGAPAVALLKRLAAGSNYEFVFPSDTMENRPYAGIKRFYRALFKAAELEGVTPHVLRHSFASVGADLGFSDSTIGSMLGHTGSGITSRYTHRLDSVLIAAADQIAHEVEKQMAGKAPAK